MPPEEYLKLVVNYGLGTVLALGIAWTFVCHLRDEKKQAISREERLMSFMEKHSVVTQEMIKAQDVRSEASAKNMEEANRRQREEHEKMLTALLNMTVALEKVCKHQYQQYKPA